MAAEWELIGYRVDADKLYAVVGGNDTKLRAAVLKAGKGSKDEDDRLKRTPEELVDEILSGTLVDQHATSYRIMLEAFLDAGAKRISFDLDKLNKGMRSLVTYALKDELGKALIGCGLPILGKGWDRDRLHWPWKTSKRVTWPAVAYWDHGELAKAEREVAKARPPSAEVIAALLDDDDEDFAEDMVGAVTALRAIVKGARGKLSKPPALAGGSEKDGLLVYYDGEQ